MIREIAITIAVVMGIVWAQDVVPKVMDNGGGVAHKENTLIISSIGQAVPGISFSGNTVLESGFITDLIFSDYITEPHKTPAVPQLSEFAPNPFNSLTSATITIPEQTKIELRIFTLDGRLIHYWSADKPAGIYKLTFSPKKNSIWNISIQNHRRWKGYDWENSVCQIGDIINRCIPPSKSRDTPWGLFFASAKDKPGGRATAPRQISGALIIQQKIDKAYALSDIRFKIYENISQK